LADNKASVKAKADQIANEDLIVEAGPTDIPAGPMISEFAEAGIKVKVENGKLSIIKDTVVTKKGEKIKANVAGILSKLDIIPFKIGLNPLAAYDSKENKVFKNIKIDKEKTFSDVSLASLQAINLALNSSYPCKETIVFLIGKASLEANAIEKLNKTPKEEIKESPASTDKINSQGG
jgi:large subunit ribosomal protein L10